MPSQGPGQLEDVVEDECRVTKSVDAVRVVPVRTCHGIPISSCVEGLTGGSEKNHGIIWEFVPKSVDSGRLS